MFALARKILTSFQHPSHINFYVAATHCVCLLLIQALPIRHVVPEDNTRKGRMRRQQFDFKVIYYLNFMFRNKSGQQQEEARVAGNW